MVRRIDRIRVIAFGLVLLFLTLPRSIQAHNADKTAYAIPLADIVIDGRLDDWPEEMAIYPIEWVSPRAYKRQPPSGPGDLTASFRAGYNVEENLLYLAVIAGDEDQVVRPEMPSFANQDLCEVYVDADHSGGDASGGNLGLGPRGTQQYAMVPGPGKASVLVDGNPALVSGDTQATGIWAAVLRLDEFTVYEWAIPLFVAPGEPLEMRVGQTIGFDAVVTDTDGLEPGGNWVAWTPETNKVGNSDRMGDLSFVKSYDGLEVTLEQTTPVDYSAVGAVAGRVAQPEGGEPFERVQVEFWRGDEPVAASTTDSTGFYRQSLPAGEYTIKSSPRGVREEAVRKVEVVGGEEVRADLALEDPGTCFYVDDDAPEGGDGSSERPFASIQAALEATSAGDSVRVAAGVYREPVELVSGVFLLGAGADSTVLDGEGKRGVMEIVGVSNVVVEGFAIVGGRGERFGGIVVASSRNARVAHNLISGNISESNGGGAVFINVDSSVVFAHNLVVGNATERPEAGGSPGGGGLYFLGAQAVLHHNTIAFNRAAGEGGGVLIERANPLFSDNIVACNTNGGIAYNAAVSTFSIEKIELPRLFNNDVWNNAGYDYSGLQPGTGDFSRDPQFAAPSQGDFSLASSSPCRGAGKSGDVGGWPGGALEQAVPPAERIAQFVHSPSLDEPVIRPVNFRSLRLPTPRKTQIDTVQIEVKPLELDLLPYAKKVFDQSDGLPSNQVWSVAPAPDGSVWMGTNQGAARYDGLWTYVDTLDGLPANEVWDILPARDGTVWILTKYGLARYRAGEVEVVANDEFFELVEDPAGGIWLQGEEMAFVDTVWTYFSAADSAGRPYETIPHTADESGGIWMSLNSRISEYPVVGRYRSEGMEVYELPRLSLVIPHWRRLHSLQVVPDGLWMGFHESRLMEAQWYRLVVQSIGHLNTETESLRVYRLGKEWEAERRYSLQVDSEGRLWVFGDQIAMQFDGMNWYGAKEVEFASPEVELDAAGNFWFGGQGATRYGLPTWTSFEGEERMEGQRVRCVAEDGEGNLWFGGDSGLVQRGWDGRWSRPAVVDTLVRDVLVDRDGKVWAAGDGGVYRYDGREWTHYTAEDGLSDTTATALAQGGDGRVWAGTGRGLFWWDGAQWQRLSVTDWPLRRWQSPNSILDLYADAQGKLWVATEAGLYRYDGEEVRDYYEIFYAERGVDLDRLLVLEDWEGMREGLVDMLTEPTDLAWLLVKGNSRGGGESEEPKWQQLNRAYVQLAEEEAAFRTLERQALEDGYVEMSSSNVFVPDVEPEWQALAILGNQPVSSIFADGEGELWFVGPRGVFRREEEEWIFEEWSDMPFGAQVAGGEVDREGNLWLATGNGAARYDGREWMHLDAADGLPTGEVLAVLEDREETLFFATAKGIARYRPDGRPPQTRVLRGPVGTVGHGTSALVFEFEGGDWEWEKRGLVFSHALLPKGSQPQAEDWSAWSAQPFAQLPPPGDGAHTFYVRARDKALNVDAEPAAFSFYMAPPLWREPWFQASTGFGLLLIVLTSGYAVGKRRQARRAERRLFEEMQKELQTAHELQMRLMSAEAPRIEGLDLAGRCLTANHVGGDFFQYFEHEGVLEVCMADVTGHAMEAAVPVMMFSGVLKTEMRHGDRLETLFANLNQTMSEELDKRTFVCFAMSRLESATRVFRLANGGCPYPYHFRAAQDEVAELQVDAYPLGVNDQSAYATIEMQLEVSDYVVFCSDGIIEAANATEELFGFERTAETIGKGCREGLSAEQLIEQLLGAVQDFAGDAPQGDDMTVVVLKVEA